MVRREPNHISSPFEVRFSRISSEIVTQNFTRDHNYLIGPERTVGYDTMPAIKPEPEDSFEMDLNETGRNQ